MASFSLIASAAYVDQELAIEFGCIPPAFLPVGVARLYETQITRLQPFGPVYLTIPEDYNVPPHDARRLEERGVSLVRVPNDLLLGDSIIYALNYIDMPSGVVRLLHGDTLIGQVDLEATDTLAIQHEGDDYAWASVTIREADNVITDIHPLQLETDTQQPIVCGYFCFSSSRNLVRMLTRARGNFIEGINLYAREYPLKAIHTGIWHDFGHLQTYFRSRREVTTQRVFNSLYIDDRIVRKSSNDPAKMQDEAGWLSKVPSDIQPFTARLLDSEQNSYTVEYVYAPTLSELFVFCGIGRATWHSIMASCREFLAICQRFTAPPTLQSGDVLSRLAIDKTFFRLKQYAAASGFDVCLPITCNNHAAPSLEGIAKEMIGNLDLVSSRPATIMHGDFCLSNILYNSRARRICVIDPRGHVPEIGFTVFGDIRYDLAKLWHSLGGLYDLIIAGHYQFSEEGSHHFHLSFPAGPHHEWVQADFQRLIPHGISLLEIESLTVLLFISMLPLHADRPDRQKAFIANAVRLYHHIKEAY